MNNNTYDYKRMKTELSSNQDVPLVFESNGIGINPGYHVTEIKQASVSSLDCGRKTENWNEMVVQLLDGKANSTEGHMLVSKFLNIVQNPSKDKFDHKLYFEFSSNNSPYNKMLVDGISVDSNRAVVQLAALKPECKPATRLIGEVYPIVRTGYQPS